MAVAIAESKLKHQRVLINGKDYYHEKRPQKQLEGPPLVKLMLVLLGPLMTPLANGYVLGVLNVIFLCQQWKDEFQLLPGVSLNLLTTGAGFGGLAGFCLHNLKRGTWERQDKSRLLIWGTWITLFGGCFQSLCLGYWSFFLARFLCGLGTYISNTAASGLLSELSPPKYKEHVETAYSILLPIGLLCGNSSDHTKPWRSLSAYQMVLPVLQLILICNSYIPSFKYLIYKGDVDNCRQLIERFQTSSRTSVDEQMAGLKMACTSNDYISPKELVCSGSTQKYIITGFILPFVCIHFGNGIILNIVAEALEFTYGLNTPQQQIVINLALLSYSLSAILIRKSSPSLSTHQHVLYSLLTTGLVTLSFVFTHGCLFVGTFSYDLTVFSISILAFTACAHITLIGLPTSYLSSWAPKHASTNLSTIIGMSSNFATLYNGFVNAWSMERYVWLEYSVTCLMGFIFLTLLTLFSATYKTRPLESL